MARRQSGGRVASARRQSGGNERRVVQLHLLWPQPRRCPWRHPPQPHINAITHNPSAICTPRAVTPWTLPPPTMKMEVQWTRKK
jgi:hypothetical protein